MMVRLLPIRVGARVRARSGIPYELPAGLAAGSEVLVLSYDPQTYRHVVRDDSGCEWTINALQNLDAGSEYRFGDRWLPAGHPEVAARLARQDRRGRAATFSLDRGSVGSVINKTRNRKIDSALGASPSIVSPLGMNTSQPNPDL